LLERGEIKTHIFATFPFEAAADAHAVMDANQQIGKVVLAVDPDQLAG
jgi:NADPH:quinone reductase-like Zn-dependent oxidoreductase